jgi:squalene-hopene/tetraprenyl-beta-curcumene cyclase
VSFEFQPPARWNANSAAVFPSAESTHLDLAIARTRDWLLAQQHPDGFWCGELEGDTILESEYILLLAWLGHVGCVKSAPTHHFHETARRCANYLLEQQLPNGGWAMYPGGKLEISGSVKAYFALKLAGHAADEEPMQRARDAILAAGGADRVNSFTRFYLALLGQLDYRHCPAVPPEMVLLPTWLPITLYRISAWSRTIFVPLSIMWAHRPVRPLPKEFGIQELFVQPPDEWPALSCPGLNEPRGLFTWEKTFRWLDRALKFFERWRLRPLRRWALRVAEKWMLDRMADSDGLGAIFPPIIWSAVALRCLGYAEDSPEVQSCLGELERLQLGATCSRTRESSGELQVDSAAARSLTTSATSETIRLQPCLSPVWDTTITLRALAAAGVGPQDERVRRGIEWLLAKEVRTCGDWSRTVKAKPGGWFFEHRNAFYPDVDDTAMALLALADQLGIEYREGALLGNVRAKPQSAAQLADLLQRATEAAQRGLDWMLAMQNRDGGWGAFDRDNDAEFLCRVPFADHNAMIDPSTPDLSARVLEALGRLRLRIDHHTVARCIAYLRQTQERDGSWFGRWGVNYIYGTWQVLVGLRAIGLSLQDEMVQRGADWLELYQHASGAWGESPESYERPELRGVGSPTASQTAWAILGLIAAGRGRGEAVGRGIRWLRETQQPDGTWNEPEFTGTGFPRVFYLKYHYYRVYFPLLALCRHAGPAGDLGSRQSRRSVMDE